LVRLTVIDDLWADYLAGVAELRSGIHWVSWANRDPLHEYLTAIHRMYQELEDQIRIETRKRMKRVLSGEFNPRQRGATWTYLTTDQPFGTLSERILKGFMKHYLKTKTYD